MSSIDIYPEVPLDVLPFVEIVEHELSDLEKKIIEVFEFPKEAEMLVDFFLEERDKAFFKKTEKTSFNESEIDEEYRKDAFKRGIISKTDTPGEYKFNNFYGMLDVFCVNQTKKYHSLSREVRKKLDSWYFEQYISGFDQNLAVRPTSDRIVPLHLMLEFIDKHEGPLYLSRCDCKCLGGECGLPNYTCINYAPGINSFAARGISKEICKHEAKQIIIDADKAGLIHTISDHGICNCCTDCCYLFRAAKRRDSDGFWPKTETIIEIDTDSCVGCGLCTKRCPFGVFEKVDKKVTAETSRCVGCGLCEQTCPRKALKLKSR